MWSLSLRSWNQFVTALSGIIATGVVPVVDLVVPTRTWVVVSLFVLFAV